MNGGFRKARPTGFSERNLKKNLADTESEASEIAGLISTLEKRKTSNEEEVSRLRVKKSELEGEIIKIEKSLHLDEGDISATKGSKVELGLILYKLDEEFGAT